MHPSGEKLPETVQMSCDGSSVFHEGRCRSRKNDWFRGFLEENTYRLTGSQQLRE